MVKVLFVCLGNICRSPLAEGIFLEKIIRLGLGNEFSADSCGTGRYNLGDPPDTRTLLSAKKNGIQLRHVARQLRPEDLDEFDHIFVMDDHNLRDARRLAKAHHHAKIHLLRTFDPHGTGDVPDPYYGEEKDFQEVYEMLDRAIDGLIVQLFEKNKAR